MKEVIEQFLTGERAMFQAKDCNIGYCTFGDGESPIRCLNGSIPCGIVKMWL